VIPLDRSNPATKPPPPLVPKQWADSPPPTLTRHPLQPQGPVGMPDWKKETRRLRASRCGRFLQTFHHHIHPATYGLLSKNHRMKRTGIQPEEMIRLSFPKPERLSLRLIVPGHHP
jgi:hypothetical protein